MKKQAILFFMMFFLLFSGCTHLNKKETHKVLAGELAKQYIGLHAQFENLQETLPESKLDDLQELAPLMDKVKYLLIDYIELVKIGEGDSQKAMDKRELIIEVLSYLTEKIGNLALEQWEEEA